MAEAKGRVGRDGALAPDDAGDPVRRHADLPREGGGGQTERLELLGEVLPGVDGCARLGDFRQLICTSTIPGAARSAPATWGETW